MKGSDVTSYVGRHERPARNPMRQLSVLRDNPRLLRWFILAAVVSVIVLSYLQMKRWYIDNVLWPPPSKQQESRFFQGCPELNVPRGYWKLVSRYTDVTAYGFRGDGIDSKVEVTVESLINSKRWVDTGILTIDGIKFRVFERQRPHFMRIHLSHVEEGHTSLCLFLSGLKDQLDGFQRDDKFRELVQRTLHPVRR